MCSSKTKALRPFEIGGAVLLSGALLAASSAFALLAAQQSWTPSVETEAETAYRAINERSYAKPKAMVKYAERRKEAHAPLVTSAIVPDLPVRKAAESAGTAEHTAGPAAPGSRAGRTLSEGQVITEPLIRKPNGLGDVLTTQVVSEEQEAAAESKAVPQTTGDQYCKNIGNAAADARFAWQKRTLSDTEKQVEKRVEELNAKIAEYQQWLARRDDFSRKAQSTITDIYAKMKPDAAAQQLAALDEETAAAVITKLSPKISSALMSEMDAKKAARLTAIIASSAKGPKGTPPASPPSGGT